VSEKRNFERLARHNAVGFTQRTRMADGTVAEAAVFVKFAQPVIVGARELARLESLGAVAPEGWTADDLKAERDATSGAYRRARQHSAIGAA
jgi:hypothetical protein